jgi:hypothetical protein
MMKFSTASAAAPSKEDFSVREDDSITGREERQFFDNL